MPFAIRWLILSALLMALRPPSYVSFTVGVEQQRCRDAGARNSARIGASGVKSS